MLIDEKKNPEIRANLGQMRKLSFCAIMKQSSFGLNFEKKIIYFIKKQMKNIEINLKLRKIKYNGANQIIGDIIKSYEKSKFNR